MGKKTVWALLTAMAAAVLIFCGYAVLDHVKTDRTPPVITIDSPEISLGVQDPQSVLLQGVTARDETDGDVTAGLIIERVYGKTEDCCFTVTYAVADSAGNVAKAERTARYTDYRAPRFTLSAPLVFEFGGNWDVMDIVGAGDVFDGDIQRRIKAAMLTSGTSVAEEGLHDVQFQVTNSAGDTARLVMPVEVYPVGAYDAQLRLTDYLVYLPAGAALDAEDYLLSFETRHEKLDLSRGIPDGLRMQISGAVDSRTPGLYPVTYTAVYTNGGYTYTGYTKLLVVVEGQAAE